MGRERIHCGFARQRVVSQVGLEPVGVRFYDATQNSFKNCGGF